MAWTNLHYAFSFPLQAVQLGQSPSKIYNPPWGGLGLKLSDPTTLRDHARPRQRPTSHTQTPRQRRGAGVTCGRARARRGPEPQRK